VNEYFPYKVLDKILSVLLFNVAIQIAVLAILHHNINLGIHNERIKISYNEVTVEVRQQLNFNQGFHGGVLLHFVSVNHFYNVALISD